LTFKKGGVRKFSAAGKLLLRAVANGNETSLTYNGSGDLITITDPCGRVLTVAPHLDGQIAQLSDSAGVIANYEYNVSPLTLKTVTYPDGSKYKFEYTTRGAKTLLATVKDALNNILETHDYDSQARATTSEVDGGNEKYILQYTS